MTTGAAAQQPRLAVRAILWVGGRLLLVNAFGDPTRSLWCAPGGGVEAPASLEDNLIREIHEETGLHITTGPLAAVREFSKRDGSFHQVELFFWADLAEGTLTPDWSDPAGVVTKRRFVTPEEGRAMDVAPPFLFDLARGDAPRYHGLVPMRA